MSVPNPPTSDDGSSDRETPGHGAPDHPPAGTTDPGTVGTVGAGGPDTSDAPATEEAGVAEPDEASSSPVRGVSPLVTVAIALIAGLVGLTLGSTVLAPEAVPAASALDDLTRPVLGEASAPVTLAVYSDFGCPYCQQHDEDIEPVLIDRYVRDGQVRLEWHDVPFQGPASLRLAVAGRAAHAQDGFWAFKEAAFATDGRDASPARLRQLAVEAGLDVARFERDLEDPSLELAVRRDQQAAMELGIRGTPAFMIGEQALVGLQPLSAFEEALAAALAPTSGR